MTRASTVAAAFVMYSQSLQRDEAIASIGAKWARADISGFYLDELTPAFASPRKSG